MPDDPPVKDQSEADPLALLDSAGLMQFLEGALQEVRGLARPHDSFRTDP